ncbi:MAG: hypothetical protein WC604_01325 [Candidatus Gracilibacteria bacterium]
MGDILAQVLTWIMGVFIALFGELLLFLVEQLIEIATYNKFVNSTAVVNGWVIVRDLCNMFFVVVLLAIAIATILKIEMYHYKKLLGRLVIMAIVINFSKTIAGIIIDFSQVLTLTFVNGFKAAAGGNFVQALGLDKIMALEPGRDDITAWQIAGSYALALIMLIVSCVVVGTMLAVFLIRMVMLWILIVLSPLAFFLTTFPQGQKYASQWWSQFGNYVLVGPVMAFFLWLSLISVSTLGPNDRPDPLGGSAELQKIGITEIGGKDAMQAFIIAIGMLVGSLVITQQMGIMGSSLAGSAVAGMKKVGMAAVRKPVAWAGKKAGKYYNRGADIAYGRTGIALPGSKLRTEMKEEREKTLHRDRLYAGQAKSADRVAGGRVGIMMAAATLMDPGLARKMGTLGVLKMAVGADKSKASMERYATLQKRKADMQRLGEDPEGAYRDILSRDQKGEFSSAETKEKQAKDLREKNKGKFGELENLEGQEKTLEGEIGGMADAASLEASVTSLQEAEKAAAATLDKLAEDTRRYYEEMSKEDILKEIPDAEAQIDAQVDKERAIRESECATNPRFSEEIDKEIRAAGFQPFTPEADALMKARDGLMAEAGVVANYRQSKKTSLDKQGVETEDKLRGLARERQDKETELVGRKDKEKQLGEIKVKLGDLRVDEAVKKTIKLEVEAKAHRGKVEELKTNSKLEGNAFAAKAREHFTKLASAASFVDAASFVSTTEGQTLLRKIQDRAKRELTEELGREPTDDEVKQKRADVMKKMAATSA